MKPSPEVTRVHLRRKLAFVWPARGRVERLTWYPKAMDWTSSKTRQSVARTYEATGRLAGFGRHEVLEMKARIEARVAALQRIEAVQAALRVPLLGTGDQHKV